MIMEEEERAKVATEAMKGPVDHTTLQLHNLRYEKNYYLRAIKAAKEFRSKYPADDLVSEDEFFGDAPEELRADPVLREDTHKLKLQRLNFELYQVIPCPFGVELEGALVHYGRTGFIVLGFFLRNACSQELLLSRLL